uniref:Uncharacterized protein n=1 Tax=Panagrolaimus sp. ES5 TaxID=591445 RepID=A0AC34GF41_9BILA
MDAESVINGYSALKCRKKRIVRKRQIQSAASTLELPTPYTSYFPKEFIGRLITISNHVATSSGLIKLQLPSGIYFDERFVKISLFGTPNAIWSAVEKLRYAFQYFIAEQIHYNVSIKAKAQMNVKPEASIVIPVSTSINLLKKYKELKPIKIKYPKVIRLSDVQCNNDEPGIDMHDESNTAKDGKISNDNKKLLK